MIFPAENFKQNIYSFEIYRPFANEVNNESEADN